MCSHVIASYPGLPIFFNVTREKLGRPGRSVHVIGRGLGRGLRCSAFSPTQYYTTLIYYSSTVYCASETTHKSRSFVLKTIEPRKSLKVERLSVVSGHSTSKGLLGRIERGRGLTLTLHVEGLRTMLTCFLIRATNLTFVWCSEDCQRHLRGLSLRRFAACLQITVACLSVLSTLQITFA